MELTGRSMSIKMMRNSDEDGSLIFDKDYFASTGDRLLVVVNKRGLINHISGGIIGVDMV